MRRSFIVYLSWLVFSPPWWFHISLLLFFILCGVDLCLSFSRCSRRRILFLGRFISLLFGLVYLLSGCRFITPHCWCLNVDDNIKCLCVYIEYPPTFASLSPPLLHFFGIDTPFLLLQSVCGARNFLFVVTVFLNLPFHSSIHPSVFVKELYLTSQVPLDGATDFMYEYCLFYSCVAMCRTAAIRWFGCCSGYGCDDLCCCFFWHILGCDLGWYIIIMPIMGSALPHRQWLFIG